MEPSVYHTLYQLEDTHWWCVGMRRLAWAFLDRLQLPAGAVGVLDLGCGTGGLLRELGERWPAVGADLSEMALGYCRGRGLAGLVLASAESLPFAHDTFGLVTCMDVLYHRTISDDVAALREVRRVLHPGGWLLLRVPAYAWLWSAHDAAEHAARRYTAGALRQRLETAGFGVRRLTYANTLLFPVAAARRLWHRAFASPTWCDLQPTPSILNRLFLGALKVEARWLKNRDLPFGLSVLALAQKP